MHPGILSSMLNQPQFRPVTRASAVSRIFGANSIPPAAAEERYTFPKAGVGLGGFSGAFEDTVFSLRQQLAQAEIERRKCDEYSALDVASIVGGVITLGISTGVTLAGKAECILRWDGQIAHFKQAIANEINAERARVEKQKADAEAQLVAKRIAAAKKTGSSTSAMTAGGLDMAKYLPIGLGVLALGFAGYMFLRK